MPQTFAALSAGDQGASQPQGELFLAVWDPVNQISYTRDLGVDVLTSDFTTPLSFAADSLFTSTFAVSNFADLRYSVVGSNNDLVNEFVLGIWTTSADDVLSIAADLNFTGLNTMAQNTADYVIGVNEASGSTDFSVDVSSVITDVDSPGFYGNEFTFNETFGSVVSFQSGAAIGESMAFFNLFASAATGGNVAIEQFADGATPFVWTLGLDGTLSYAPVPVPAAVWLFGSALAAFLGLRRRAS